MTSPDNRLEEYAKKFQNLRSARVQNHLRPHKPVMLLAVLSLADNGLLIENKIRFTPELSELFREYFDVVATENDSCTPENPFFFLRSDAFWHHQPRAGQELAYKAMREPGGIGLMNSIIDHAYLDEDLFALVANNQARSVLRDALISRYFAQHRTVLQRVALKEQNVGDYMKALEGKVTGEVAEVSAEVTPEDVRNATFRRIVVRVYDYRCAACGLRLYLDDRTTIVDAAHIVPFNVSGDDDPRNGISLCKNHHWAMDRNLIAPGPDLRWHLHKRLDERYGELRCLLDLYNQELIKPHEAKYYPKEESLTWRLKHLKAI